MQSGGIVDVFVATFIGMAKDGTIALFLPSPGRDGLQGGAELVAVTLAREFVEAGHRVDLVLSVTHPSSSAEVDKRVRIVDLRCRRLSASLPRLIAYRWRERPSVILSLMPLANSLNVLSAWFGPPGSRAVLLERNAESIALDADFSAEGTRLLRPVCRLTYPPAAAITGFSPGVAERARAAYTTAASRTVGIPNPVAEGTPIVTTDCPTGPSEILDGGRHGTLVPVGDAKAPATAVIATLDDPPDPARLVARAAEFALPVITARYLQTLDRATHEEPVTTAADR